MPLTPVTRQRILDAAERLFAEHGFDATATSKIAALAAVPKGLLFYYFPTKTDLLRSLVGERLSFAPIDTGPLIEPGNPVRSLLNLTKKLYEVQSRSEVLRVIILREERTHPEVKANLLAHRNQLQAVIEHVLRSSIRHPIAAMRLRAAAQAWVAIFAIRPLDGSAEEQHDAPGTDLPALAELICAGLTSTA